MQISMISFSVQGAKLSNRIKEQLLKSGLRDPHVARNEPNPHEAQDERDLHLVQNTTNERAAELVPQTSLSLREWTGEQFREADVIIFIGACGIAVRGIAPFVADKKTDPAVLVIDDCGQYVISLLSGHLGGANAWARRVAKWIGALPVVTTASDSNGKLAIDLFAEKNQLFITDMRMAKVLESACLDGERIGVRSDIPCFGELPEGFSIYSPNGDGASQPEMASQDGESRLGMASQEKQQYGIYIGMDPSKKNCFKQTLWLIPRRLIAGIGCRKGKPEAAVLGALEKALLEKGYPREALLGVASIDLKKEEPGIRDTVERWNRKYGKLFCDFYTAKQLKTVEGSSSGSSFVKEVTGVDNVCERAALYAAMQLSGEKGKLVLEKQIMDGVTVALAEIERRIRFE